MMSCVLRNSGLSSIKFLCATLSHMSIFPRLVMQDLPSQKTIYERKAKKIKDCSQLDIYDAGAATFTISLRSPVEEYAQSLRQGMEMQL